jgi:hypothetical protein
MVFMMEVSNIFSIYQIVESPLWRPAWRILNVVVMHFGTIGLLRTGKQRV